jgi:hypothetical protein
MADHHDPALALRYLAGQVSNLLGLHARPAGGLLDVDVLVSGQGVPGVFQVEIVRGSDADEIYGLVIADLPVIASEIGYPVLPCDRPGSTL